MEHRQEIAYQQDLFIGQSKDAICQSDRCEDVHRAKVGQEGQVDKEGRQGRALANNNLMAIVCTRRRGFGIHAVFLPWICNPIKEAG